MPFPRRRFTSGTKCLLNRPQSCAGQKRKRRGDSCQCCGSAFACAHCIVSGLPDLIGLALATWWFEERHPSAASSLSLSNFGSCLGEGGHLLAQHISAAHHSPRLAFSFLLTSCPWELPDLHWERLSSGCCKNCLPREQVMHELLLPAQGHTQSCLLYLYY